MYTLAIGLQLKYKKDKIDNKFRSCNIDRNKKENIQMVQHF